MPNISLMIHTASQDNFLSEHGIPSYFGALIDNLSHQTFKDFELVYVDTNYYEENKQNFANLVKLFPVKHVPIHPEHRYWYDKKYIYISAAKNTGILHADGELLITCDDGEFFPDDFLSLYWHYYKTTGEFLHCLHKRMKSINVVDGKVVRPIGGDIYVNDNRFNSLGKRDVFSHTHGSWTYAGTSFTLEAALKLNGFNERMDGCKSLEDCDFGNRLTKIGHKFVLDRRCFAYIVDHRSYKDVMKLEDFIAVENYGTFRWPDACGIYVANEGTVSKKQLSVIQTETLKYRGFDPLADENKEKLAIWLGTPTFDMRKQRSELRNTIMKDEPIKEDNMSLQSLVSQIQLVLPQIHGWCSIEKAVKFAEVILEKKPNLCVEIGVFGGSSLIPQAMTLKQIGQGKLYGIDPWATDAALEEMRCQANKDWWSTVNLDDIHKHAQSQIDGLGLNSHCELVKSKAEDAVSMFEPESIDVLHIDGNHSEALSYKDAVLYLPKVKKGGIIFFDDIWWTEGDGQVSTRKAILYLLEHCRQVDLVKDCMILEKN